MCRYIFDKNKPKHYLKKIILRVTLVMILNFLILFKLVADFKKIQFLDYEQV